MLRHCCYFLLAPFSLSAAPAGSRIVHLAYAHVSDSDDDAMQCAVSVSTGTSVLDVVTAAQKKCGDTFPRRDGEVYVKSSEGFVLKSMSDKWPEDSEYGVFLTKEPEPEEEDEDTEACSPRSAQTLQSSWSTWSVQSLSSACSPKSFLARMPNFVQKVKCKEVTV